MRRRRILSNLMIVPVLLMSLGGCASKEAASGDIMPTIELIEPVGTAQGYEKASVRDICVVSTYSGIICPDTVEYTYESALAFSSYAALPGESV